METSFHPSKKFLLCAGHSKISDFRYDLIRAGPPGVPWNIVSRNASDYTIVIHNYLFICPFLFLLVLPTIGKQKSDSSELTVR